MAIYYYEDQNGKYSSHTDARRFSRVSGKEAYAYLKSAEGKTRRKSLSGCQVRFHL